MSFEIAIQTVVYQTLTGHAPLVAMIEDVLDYVEEYQAFPYVTIGESTHNENDTVAVFGDDSTITIHTWCRFEAGSSGGKGRKQTKQIQGAIYDALHRAKPTYTGYNIMGIDWVNSQSFIDSDGETHHGVQTFRILIDKVN